MFRKHWSDKTPHTGYRITINYEPVYIFRKLGEREEPSEDIKARSRITKEQWDQWASGVWQINHVHEMKGHPAIYPDELVSRLVQMFSFEGDLVLDPFLGSGTTIKVARELNRQGIGYEREASTRPSSCNGSVLKWPLMQPTGRGPRSDGCICDAV
jgi:DNA modification methylase